MLPPQLADSDLGALVKLGIVALFLLSSIVGPIIARLRARSGEQSEGELLNGGAQSPPRPAERARPAIPVAKPMPPHPPVASTVPQPLGPTHPQAGTTAPMAKPAPGQAVPAAMHPRPGVHPPGVPPGRPPVEVERRVPTPGPGRPARPAPRRKSRPSKPRKVPASESLEELMRSRDVILESAISGEQIHDDFEAIRHPTREALRRAIVLNEVLGPPLSLRGPDDSPWR